MTTVLGLNPREQNDKAVYPAAVLRWYPLHKSGSNWHAMVETAATLPLTLCLTALRARLQGQADE